MANDNSRHAKKAILPRTSKAPKKETETINKKRRTPVPQPINSSHKVNVLAF